MRALGCLGQPYAQVTICLGLGDPKKKYSLLSEFNIILFFFAAKQVCTLMMSVSGTLLKPNTEAFSL